MNAEQLLAHYDKVADAPDAVARLRKFVLDLAVRGKLVEQDASEPAAAELLRQIFAHKRQATSRKSIDSSSIKPVSPDLTPFELPAGWVCAKFGDIVISRDGERIPVSKEERNRRAKLFDYYGASGIIDKIDAFLFDKPLLLIGEDGANLINRSTPIAYIARGKYWVNNHAHVLDGLSVEFLQYIELFINSTDLKPYVTGSAQPKMNQAKMNSIPVALPPLLEQQRILAKFEELMGLCDRLEAARAEREATRDRLAAASLARLNAPDPDTFRADARFALSVLPDLTARADQIKQLRQTILNLAVRGKLVAQDVGDEPARDLLRRVANERRTLLTSGCPNPDEAKSQLKKLEEQEVPTSLPPIPSGWSWATLFQCAALIVDCKNKTAPYSKKGIRLIRTTNVRDGVMNSFDQKFVDESTARAWSLRCTPAAGDILITREAPMGEVCIVPEGETICLGQRMMLVRIVPGTMNKEFLLYSLRDPKLLERAQDKPIGATVQHLRVGGVETLLVPVPPLAEQERIVTKLDELMSACSVLEAAVASAESKRRPALNAILRIHSPSRL